MGRWIDRAALTALTALGLYLLFLSAFDSIIVAGCLAFVCCGLLFRARHKRGEKYHMTRLQAQSILEGWAYGSDDEAQSQIEALMDGQQGELIYLAKHPTATLSMNDVFSAWKAHRNAEKLIVAAVCHSDGRARTFAATLKAPTIEILDAARLIPMVRRSSLPPPHALRGRQLFIRIKLLLTALPSRRPWHRNLLIGLGLMLVYLVSGSPAYLALSIGSLFIAGVSVRARA